MFINVKYCHFNFYIDQHLPYETDTAEFSSRGGHKADEVKMKLRCNWDAAEKQLTTK